MPTRSINNHKKNTTLRKRRWPRRWRSRYPSSARLSNWKTKSWRCWWIKIKLSSSSTTSVSPSIVSIWKMLSIKPGTIANSAKNSPNTVEVMSSSEKTSLFDRSKRISENWRIKSKSFMNKSLKRKNNTKNFQFK